MGKHRPNSSNIEFEKLDQNDRSMEKIFKEIENVPDKDLILEVSKSKNLKQRGKSSSYKLTSRPDQEIDLHGKTREESIFIVQNFVMTCFKKKLNSGLIITGKGHHSGEKGPVLNREVKIWLEQNGESYLKAFFDAPPKYGGAGAIFLLFKK